MSCVINVKTKIYLVLFIVWTRYSLYICIIKIKQQYNGNTEIQQE